jgi:hypothetical protein
MMIINLYFKIIVINELKPNEESKFSLLLLLSLLYNNNKDNQIANYSSITINFKS